MSRRKRADPPPVWPGPDGITVRRHLAKLSRDPEYLMVKAEMGEPLTPAEREVVDAWRAVARALDGPPPGGGAP